MASTAYVRYCTFNFVSLATLPDLSAFTQAAPLTQDFGIGDTTTGYSNSLSSGSAVLFDFTAPGYRGDTQAAPTLDTLETAYSWSAAEFGWELHGSDDGVTWTLILQSVDGSTYIPFSPQTWRYWRFCAQISSTGTIDITDIRLFDTNGFVVEYAPPPAPWSDMEQHNSSTGQLTVSPLLRPVVAQKSVAGTASAAQGLLSPNTSPTAFPSAATAAAGDWALIDLGAAMDVTRLALYGCFDSPAGTAGVSAWITNNAAATPGGSGTTTLGAAAPTPGGGPQTVVFGTLATAVNGRYLIIATANVGAGLSVSFDWLEVWGDVIPFNAVQTLDSALTFAVKELMTDAHQSQMAIDYACMPPAGWTISAENLTIRADSLEQLMMSQISGSAFLENTIGAQVTVTTGIVQFSTSDTNGNSLVYTLNRAHGKGIGLAAKLSDFMAQKFEFYGIEDAVGNIGSIAMQQ